jgi:hypothetical protein
MMAYKIDHKALPLNQLFPAVYSGTSFHESGEVSE